LGKDVITLFTDPLTQQEILAFIEGRTGAPCFRCFKVAQSGSEGTTYLDVSFQRVCDSEEHHIGFVGAIRDITEKVSLERRLRKLSLKDDLTNLLNQRGFFRVLKREMELSRKLHHNLSLCFLDLDNLKQCNDSYGHLYGSRVIKETAGILQKSVRRTDRCCRYGGDEFVILMPKIDKIEAQVAVERLRVTLSAYFQQKITASFGISDFSCKTVTGMDLLARADKALYRAKGLGKNRVVLSDQ
jgi:diguanylate cyclase (GGDEF)-like protein